MKDSTETPSSASASATESGTTITVGGAVTCLESPLTGPQKAAMLVAALEERAALAIVAKLSLDELAVLQTAAESVNDDDARDLASVCAEFAGRAALPLPSGRAVGATVRRLAARPLGDDVASAVSAAPGASRRGLEGLARLEAPAIAGLLAGESPRTMALVLARLPPAKASDVLEEFALDTRVEVLLRMADVPAVSEDVLQTLDAHFAEALRHIDRSPRRPAGGLSAVADVLKHMELGACRELLTRLAEVDASASQAVRRALFSFEDLLRVDTAGIQALLKQVRSEDLVLALHGASEALRAKFFANLSARAAAVLREELELIGNARAPAVTSAQEAIVELALTLRSEGELRFEATSSASSRPPKV